MKTGVLIDTNNNLQNVSLDMTQGTNSIGELLNDKLTFIGQILREPEKCNAVIMNGKNSETNKLKHNSFNIPPFDNKVYGDMFIICMDDNSEPQNFTTEDLNEYIENYECKYKKNYYE